MVMCPVTREVDLTLPFMIVPHNYVGAATSYVTSPGIGVEIISLNVRWLGGMAMGKAKYADNVTHKSAGLIQDGNDMGPLIPQLEIVPAPDNLLSFVHLLTSSCKVAFSCGDVQAQGTPIACIVPFLMPMKICGEPITVPFGYSITNVFNTVMVYPHIVDIIAGWADVIATVVIDGIVNEFVPEKFGSAGSAIMGALSGAVFGPTPSLGQAAKQNVPGLVSGLVRLVGRHLDPDYDGPAKFKVGYTQGMLGGGGYEVAYGSDGTIAHGASGEAFGGYMSGSSQTSYAPDGSVTETDTTQWGGYSSETDSHTVKPDGTVTDSHTETDNRLGGSRTETTTRTERPDGTVVQTRSVTDARSTPLIGTNRSSTNQTTETTIAPDGTRTQSTTRTHTRGGVVTSTRTVPTRSGEQVL